MSQLAKEGNCIIFRSENAEKLLKRNSLRSCLRYLPYCKGREVDKKKWCFHK